MISLRTKFDVVPRFGCAADLTIALVHRLGHGVGLTIALVPRLGRAVGLTIALVPRLGCGVGLTTSKLHQEPMPKKHLFSNFCINCKYNIEGFVSCEVHSYICYMLVYVCWQNF